MNIRGSELAIERICNPLLHPDIIYNIFTKLTGGNPLLEKLREVLEKVRLYLTFNLIIINCEYKASLLPKSSARKYVLLNFYT